MLSTGSEPIHNYLPSFP